MTPSRAQERDDKQEHAHGGYVPYEGADKENTKRIERQIDDSRTDIQEGTPFGERAIGTGCLRGEYQRGEKGERLEVVAHGALEASGYALQRRKRFVTRACSPAVSKLKAPCVGGGDNMNEPKNHAP